MITPIKTGAWLHRAEYGDYHWCDLYEIGGCLIARVNQGSYEIMVRVGDEYEDEILKSGGPWASMNTCDHEFYDTTQTWISADYKVFQHLVLEDGRYVVKPKVEAV